MLCEHNFCKDCWNKYIKTMIMDNGVTEVGVCCLVQQCVTVCHSVTQCVAVCHSVSHCDTVLHCLLCLLSTMFYCLLCLLSTMFVLSTMSIVYYVCTV